MENSLMRYVDSLVERYPLLSEYKNDIIKSYDYLEKSYANNHKLLVCGNGGSASDSEHIVGELMKEFKLKRKVYSEQADALMAIDSELGKTLAQHLQGALPAITLTAHSSLTTAFMNDSEPVLVFAQQVNGYGKKGDVFLGISTSGNSMNVLYAAVTAKSKGIAVIGLTGYKESKLSKLADVCIQVPETETYKIQELHLPVYHCLCMMLEEHFLAMKINEVDIRKYETLLLDRDGTINVHIIGDYVRSWDDFEFIPNVVETIAKWSSQLKHIFIVTNQRGIGKGKYTENDLDVIHSHMVEEIEKSGGRIDHIYFCSSLTNEDIRRKPGRGMFDDILHDYPDVEISKTLMIGDSDVDRDFAKNIGVDFVCVDSLKKQGNKKYWVLA